MSSDLKESVILITSSNSDNHRFGTGFIIHQDEHATYLLTCMHVVEDVGGLQMVKAGCMSATAIASGEKEGLDLAVLEIEGLLDKPTLNLYVFCENGSPFVAAGFQEFAKGFLIRPIRGTLGEEVGLEYRNKADRIKAWELKIDDDYSLKLGYSGAPVIDKETDYVLGVISHREGEKKGIAISIEAVERIWPGIPSDLIIKNQNQLIELQRKRISTGLEQQRQHIIEENKHRINQKRLRVVGERPQDVANYFKNRRPELKKIVKFLADPTTRLVSVVGHSGMGKTALVSKVLSDLEQNRRPHTDDEIPVDGIVYLSTRTGGINLEKLFAYCGRMLGNKQKKALISVWTNTKITIGDKVLRLLEALSQGLYVILMDNIEDLLDDDGQIIDEDLQIFFEKCFVTRHNVRLLVTSRISLAFRRNVMRFDHEVPLIEGLPTDDGIALLRELDPNGIHGLREASDKELTKVVGLVHGVPRALEVFAGILANDPFANLDEVLQQFCGRDDVVQDLIEEGYKRLDNNACRVMEALSVLGRPVPVLAVDYLLEPFVPALDVPAIARRLIRTHFVSINRDSKTLSLHPIDRDYTYSQLPEEGDYSKKALEHRAAKYYAQLRAPKEAWQTIDDLEPQLAEFEHLVKGGDYVAAAQLMNEIDAEYLSLWGYAQRVLNMRKKLLDKITDRELEMINLCNLGGAYVQLGQDREAINYFKQALEIAREIGNKNEEIRSIVQIGHSHKNLGEHEYAIEWQEKALALARKIGDQEAEWRALDKLGVIYRNKGLSW